MLELRCPACRGANAVEDASALADARCARCRTPLERDRRVRYFHVASEDSVVHGPLVRADLVAALRRRGTPSGTWISEEGGPWLAGAEREDLFPPPSRPAVHPGPRPPPAGAASGPARVRRSRGEGRAAASEPRRPVPGSVALLAGLDVLLGVLFLLLGVAALLVLSSVGAPEAGALAGLVLAVAGAGFLGLARGLRRGSRAAQATHVVLLVLEGAGVLLLASERAPAAVLLVAAVAAALPAPLLSDPEARAFFRGEAPEA